MALHQRLQTAAFVLREPHGMRIDAQSELRVGVPELVRVADIYLTEFMRRFSALLMRWGLLTLAKASRVASRQSPGVALGPAYVPNRL
jgi:hypothetical protein